MWEAIAVRKVPEFSNSSMLTERMKIPGGWLIRTTVVAAAYASDGGVAISSHTEKIEDPNHTWQWQGK